MARRRKEERRVGSASRGMVRRWGRFFSRVRPRGVPARERVPQRCHASGVAVDVCSDLPQGRSGLNARRRAVLETFRAPALCRHVPRALLRSVGLDVTPIISATTCHQSSYVETYSRYSNACALVMLPLLQAYIHDASRQELDVPRHARVGVGSVGVRAAALAGTKAAWECLVQAPCAGDRHCNAAPRRLAGVAGGLL